MARKDLSAKNKIYNIIDKVPVNVIRSIIKETPSLRGIVLGYLAEYYFHDSIGKNKNIKNIKKHDDHDRLNNKMDREFLYKNKPVSVQVKSIQTNSIRWDEKKQCVLATVQNDASCKRTITLKNGEKICTTNYKVGDYDILAVPLFPFCSNNTFAYKLNRDCKRTSYKKYTKSQQKQLLSTTEHITFPLSKEWTTSIDKIIEKLLRKK